MMDDLAKDAQKLANLRLCLANHISQARVFLDEPKMTVHSSYSTRNTVLKMLEEDFETGIKTKLNELDQIARDLLQIVSKGYPAPSGNACLSGTGVCVEFNPRGENCDETRAECHAAHLCEHLLSAAGVLRCEYRTQYLGWDPLT